MLFLIVAYLKSEINTLITIGIKNSTNIFDPFNNSGIIALPFME